MFFVIQNLGENSTWKTCRWGGDYVISLLKGEMDLSLRSPLRGALGMYCECENAPANAGAENSLLLQHPRSRVQFYTIHPFPERLRRSGLGFISPIRERILKIDWCIKYGHKDTTKSRCHLSFSKHLSIYLEISSFSFLFSLCVFVSSCLCVFVSLCWIFLSRITAR